MPKIPPYPSPCDSCGRENKDICNGKTCLPWLRRYFVRQKQINAFAKKLCGGEQTVKNHVWGYMHPDEYRRYLASDPCNGCLCRDWCDDPCPKYLAHSAARTEHLRKRAESQ